MDNVVRSTIYDDPDPSEYQKWMQKQRGSFSTGYIAEKAWVAADKRGYIRALRDVRRYVNKIKPTPNHGGEMLIVAGLKVKLDEMIDKETG